MRYRPLGNTGLLVSEVALGTVELGLDYGFRGSDHYACPTPEQAHQILRRAVDLGVNFIDTARAYGEAEARIGEILATLNPRPIIATKVHDLTAVRESVETSLRLLRIERVDLLQIHNATLDVLENDETLRTFEDLQTSGKTAFCGASVYGEPAALRALGRLNFRTLQTAYNFLDPQMASRVFPLASARRTAILVRSAFLRGVLTPRVHDVPTELSALRDRTLAACDALQLPIDRLAETALRFCLSHSSVSTVLCGVRSLPELEANVAAAELGPLDPETLRVLSPFSIDDPALTSPTEWTGLT